MPGTVVSAAICLTLLKLNNHSFFSIILCVSGEKLLPCFDQQKYYVPQLQYFGDKRIFGNEK